MPMLQLAAAHLNQHNLALNKGVAASNFRDFVLSIRIVSAEVSGQLLEIADRIIANLYTLSDSMIDMLHDCLGAAALSNRIRSLEEEDFRPEGHGCTARGQETPLAG
ncbi:hypothetical protein IL306_007443 [Fusarium sp. DS 682]|nr:hypothetical protein IL306_007443 [Fusarium sp. DS 682]